MTGWTYEIGPYNFEQPDWDEVRVDGIAAWILENIPHIYVKSLIRAGETAYERILAEHAESTEKILTQKKDHLEMVLLMERKDLEDEKENIWLRGLLIDYAKKVEAQEDLIKIKELPLTLTQQIKKVDKVSKYLETEIFDRKIIEKISHHDQDYTYLHMTKSKPRKATDFKNIFPDWSAR